MSLKLHQKLVNLALKRGLDRKIEHLIELQMIEMELLFADTEELRFASRSLKNFWELCTPRELLGDAKIRIGGNKDGGYVVAKGVQNFPDAISIGIGNDNRSDIFLAKRGVPVFEFDHTVDREPKKHKNVKFHKIGIGLGKDLIPLDEMIRITNSKDSSLLLLDVDGAEYDEKSNLTSSTLNHFSQIVVEIHDLNKILNIETSAVIFKLLEELTTHHQVIHFHANNFRPVLTIDGMSLPIVAELTLVRKSEFQFGDYDRQSPQPIDFPNDRYVLDPVLSIPS